MQIVNLYKLANIPQELCDIVYNKVAFELLRPHGVVTLSLGIHNRAHKRILLYERRVAHGTSR